MAATNEAVKAAWKKVLYIKQDYPDNYLDENQFRKDLKENLYVRNYEFKQVTLASLSVLQEVNSVFVFVLVFWLLKDQQMFLRTLFAAMGLVAVIMWFLKYYILHATSTDSFLQSLLLLLFLSGISPVLKTLTQSISSDTIWLMTVVMFFIHLLFHNYGQSAKDAPLVSDSFSLNAAIFSAVCLGSRLHTSLQTLGIVLFAIILFASLPYFRNDLQLQHGWIATFMAFLVSLITMGLTYRVFSYAGVLVYLIQVMIISLVCPYWFVRLQYLKRTINGPWDIATIEFT